MSIGYTITANHNTYTGYDDDTRNQVISAIIENRLTPALERIADTRAFTWYGFSEEQQLALQTGGRASVHTSTFGAWVKDTLKTLEAEAKAVPAKRRDPYFSGLLCVEQADGVGGSIVFVSDTGIVSEQFRAVSVERELYARITDFKALKLWVNTLKPDRMDIVGYRNGYARFNYGLRDNAKPIASVTFGPMALLWKK